MSAVNDVIEAVKSRDLARVEALINGNPALVNAKTDRGDSPILIATYYGAREIVQLLLERGAQLNVFEAAAVGDLARVQACIAADPTLVSAHAHDGFQPLGLAAFFGHPRLVEYLLTKGAEVNSAAQNPMRVMPLHSAAARKQFEIANLLVEAGADVNAQQERGWTPIHQAAHNGDLAMLELFSRHGAALSPKNQDGATPLALAIKQGHQAATQYLRDQGATD